VILGVLVVTLAAPLPGTLTLGSHGRLLPGPLHGAFVESAPTLRGELPALERLHLLPSSIPQFDEHEFLRDLLVRSETARSLVERLNESDVIVYVRFVCFDRLRGFLQLMGCDDAWRRVLITVRIGPRDIDAPAVLAHELQHAVEIADTPEVRGDETLAELYRRIGTGLSDADYTCQWETEAAIEVYDQVVQEIWQPPGQARQSSGDRR
jgi:hypothetical protein